MFREAEFDQSSILIVDDNPKNLQVLGGFLQNEGIQLEFALDGETALSWLEKSSFDLILLDVMMPGMNGYDLCRRIKELPDRKDIPIIFITAKSDPESIIKGFEAGAVDYISKPFIHNVLMARVKTQLRIRKTNTALVHHMDLLESRNKDISQSIEYARKLQNAVMADSTNQLVQLQEHFVIYQPKDVLSGDFFWVRQKDEKLIIAVMDSTGHGIPGALMSIMGISLLNEIIRRYNTTQPVEILEHLRKGLISNLGQKPGIVVVRDGMEGSIVSIDLKKRKLSFAGSFNPMLLLRNNSYKLIKGDRIPIGICEVFRPFSVSELDLEAGDQLYFFTDGILDQFGGPNDKRFKIKRLIELLLSLQDREIAQQKIILEKELDAWKGDRIQTDDILVLGFRL